jgi:hypothetical protein
MSQKLTTRRLAVAGILAAAVAGVAGLGAVPAGKAAVPIEDLPGECPPVMALADVARGMTGTGLSVVQGTEPETFDVEVLGVLTDAVGPGRDIIIVNLSGPVIDNAGGLWFGASGSPVYVEQDGEQKLVGAVAYGLAGGQSSLAGLTPAEDMVALFDPSGGGDLAPEGQTLRVPRALAARMAAKAGLSVTEVGGLIRLKTPLSISGLNDRGLRRVETAIKRQSLPLFAYAGASASAEDAGVTTELGAGDSFAAALSLGDVTAAAIGTTTVVCYDQAVAFGHPFFFNGDTTMAARAADTITIVKDPIFGSYKLANVAGNAGTLTGDHLAGIVADLGDGPSSTPVTSVVTDLDTDNSRAGESDVVLPEYVPFLSYIHLLSNIDVTIDRIGPGNSELAYTMTGTRPDGSTWELDRTNHYASRYDISFDSVWELAMAGEILQSFEGVHITSIDVSQADVEKAFEQYSLSKLLVWNGRAYVKRDFISARRGETILLRAVLTPAHRPGTQTVDLALTVPTWVRQSGYIEVRGGGSTSPEIPCFFEDEECGADGEGDPFARVLRALQNQPRNDMLQARLLLGERQSVRAKDQQQLDAVVRGTRFIGFELIGGRG